MVKQDKRETTTKFSTMFCSIFCLIFLVGRLTFSFFLVNYLFSSGNWVKFCKKTVSFGFIVKEKISCLFCGYEVVNQFERFSDVRGRKLAFNVTIKIMLRCWLTKEQNMLYCSENYQRFFSWFMFKSSLQKIEPSQRGTFIFISIL